MQPVALPVPPSIGKCLLKSHVLIDNISTNPNWVRMGCVVLTRLCDTISANLEDNTMSARTIACTVWLYHEDQFLGTNETYALLLEAEFQNFIQGDLSITSYCLLMKAMADVLDDLGKVITDCTLVLNLICDLSECLLLIHLHPCHPRPFPSFLEAHLDLLLEEPTMVKEPTADAATSLATKTKGGGGSSNTSTPHLPALSSGSQQ